MQLWSLIRHRIIGRFLSSSGARAGSDGSQVSGPKQRGLKPAVKNKNNNKEKHRTLRGVKSPTLGLMPRSQC